MFLKRGGKWLIDPSSVQVITKDKQRKNDQYQRDRVELPIKGAYPSIGDQMDMMWHDKKMAQLLGKM